MKSLLSLIIAMMSQSTWAMTAQVPVVVNYQMADQKKLWHRLHADEIPPQLIETRSINISDESTRTEKAIILQNERVVVCYKDCSSEQPIQWINKGDHWDILLSNDVAEREVSIRMLNAFYWTNQLFDFTEKLGYPTHRQLKVLVDADRETIGSRKVIRNNAFFNEANWTLTFLKNKSIPVLSLFGQKFKIRDSSWDPSVIMHETGHSVFQQVMGSVIGKELFGAHEAYADF